MASHQDRKIEISKGDLRWLEKRITLHGGRIHDYLRELQNSAAEAGLIDRDSVLPMDRREGYKLLRVRRDGSLGPLFINATQIIPEGIWLRSEYFFKAGFKFRPGWHVAPEPHAPHLKTEGRVWRRVEIADFEELPRPEAQGGTWWIARWMRVLPEKK
jgi:hypothetical protein